MASGNVNPSYKFPGTELLILYDTDDEMLNRQNTKAEARRTELNGVQFQFTGNTPGNEYYHTSGVIPSGAVRIRSMIPTVTFDNGDVKALYKIEVTDKEVFKSNV